MLKSYVTRMLNGNAKWSANFFETYNTEHAVKLSGRTYLPADNLVIEIIADGFDENSDEFYEELAKTASRFVHNPSAFAGDMLFMEAQ